MSEVWSLPKHLKIIIVSSFLMALGSFMVTPFVAVYLHQTVHMDIKLIGVVVAIATFTQFAGGLLGAAVAERFGYKKSMVIALLVRVFGFISLAYSARSPIVAIVAVIVVAACSALYMPANKAYTVSSVEPKQRPLILSLSSAAFNSGMAIGPLIAGVAVTNSPKILFLSIGVLFVILAAIHQSSLPNENSRVTQPKFDMLSTLPLTWQPFFLCLFACYLYFIFQNFMGIHITEASGSRAWGTLVFLNFATLSVTQILGRKAIASVPYMTIGIVGLLLFGLGFFLMGFGSFAFAIAGISFFSIGQGVLYLRCELELVARTPDQPTLAFGLFRLATGFGGLVSGFAGGALCKYDFFWNLIAFQCVLAASVCLVFYVISSTKVAYETTQ